MAKNLTKTGITSNGTIESWHVTQSIDAFTGQEAYDVNLSGSLSITGSLYGNNYLLNSNNFIFTGSAKITGSLEITGSVNIKLLNGNLYINNPVDDLKTFYYSSNNNSGVSSGQQIYMDNGVQSFSIGMLGINSNSWSSYGNSKDAFIRYGTGDGTTGNINFITPSTGGGGAWNFYSYRALSNNTPTLGIKSSYISINLPTSSAQANLHIRADNNLNTDLVFKTENSSSISLNRIYNNGVNINYVTSSIPASSILSNNEMTSYLDESNNKLIFLVKYSNGTVKSGSINLV